MTYVLGQREGPPADEATLEATRGNSSVHRERAALEALMELVQGIASRMEGVEQTLMAGLKAGADHSGTTAERPRCLAMADGAQR